MDKSYNNLKEIDLEKSSKKIEKELEIIKSNMGGTFEGPSLSAEVRWIKKYNNKNGYNL